ncbi:MAG TPA: FAD-dependent oxidoreductase, partial [Acidimicrobiales bacterium]|nr:FAD-dependent oxidoreductase [Acidimicrobiales bacterium]
EGGAPDELLARFGLAPRGVGDEAHRPHILVLGAGNTAMDVARMGRRLGCDATCIDWLDERYALARPDELQEARSEGVDVRFSRTLVGLEGRDGRVAVAALATTKQKRSNRPPKVTGKATERVAVDLVVMAMGYRVEPGFTQIAPGLPIRRETTGIPDRSWLASGLLANAASSFAYNSPVGALALAREVGVAAAAHPVGERTWVLGDALVGPSTVVEAMAQGRRAAAAVLAELS